MAFKTTTKVCPALLVLHFSINVCGQINDERAFFSGKYDKDYIATNHIKTVVVEGRFDTQIIPRKLFHFNRIGLLLKYQLIDSNGTEIDCNVYHYNQRNDLTQKIFVPQPPHTDNIFYFYKTYKKNKLINDSSTWMSSAINYFYDFRGRLSKTMSPYRNGYIKISRKIISNEYDILGKLIHITECISRSDSDTIEQWLSDKTIVYKEHKIDKIIEKIFNGDIPTNQGNLEYSHDSAGNIISIERDTVSSYYYTFDGKKILSSKEEKFPARKLKNWAALIRINTITNFGNSLNYFARADYESDLFIVTRDT